METTHGRDRNRAIKNVVIRNVLSMTYGQIRVQLGKGTARSWVHIRTPRPLSDDERKFITSELRSLSLIGVFYDEMTNDPRACVTFDVAREVK